MTGGLLVLLAAVAVPQVIALQDLLLLEVSQAVVKTNVLEVLVLERPRNSCLLRLHIGQKLHVPLADNSESWERFRVDYGFAGEDFSWRVRLLIVETPPEGFHDGLIFLGRFHISGQFEEPWEADDGAIWFILPELCINWLTALGVRDL